MLIDYNSFLKSLPMLTLMEYISTEILQNSYYSVRSKILKSIAMSQISLINESLQMLIIVANEKNLPVNWLRESEFLKKEKGSNWFNNSNFMIQNEIPFYDDKNKVILYYLLFLLNKFFRNKLRISSILNYPKTFGKNMVF